MKNNLTIERSMMLIMLMYPVLMLSVKGSLSAFFIVLCILSIVTLLKNTTQPVFIKSQDKIYILAMSSILVATILSQLIHGKIIVSYWDSPARFLFAVPIYFALKKQSMKVFELFQFGLPLGAIAALLIQHQEVGVFGTRATNTFLNPIHFGDLALMLGILSACSINWFRLDSRLVVMLKVIGLIAGMYASILSGTRGGWVAIPVILLVCLVVWKVYDVKKLAGGLLAVAAMLAVSYFAFTPIQQRVSDSYVEIRSIASGNLETSTGFRLQIWKGASQIFLANPIAGVSPSGFDNAILSLGKAGVISPMAADLGVNEVHSQIFSSAARLGIFGLIAYFLVHLVPLKFFVNSMRSRNNIIQKAGLMGMSLVVGFIVFGLTVEMYNLKMVATFYSLTGVVLLACCNNDNCDELTHNR